MRPLLHPSTEALARFAERSAPPGEGAVTARHLETCDRCRKTVSLLRAVASPAAEPSPGALDRVLADRAAGARVLLPTAEPAPVRIRWLWRAVAAAGIAALALMVLAPERDVAAGSRTGQLTFTPAEPRLGAELEVAYAPAGALQGHAQLVLRARYRRSQDWDYAGPPQAAVASLVPDGDGRFRGRLRLPDSVVYAAFAIESPDGEQVDHNDFALWEVLAHEEPGRPRLDALIQRHRDLMGRNWELGAETAARMAETHPDDPESWRLLTFYQQASGGDAWDTALASHQARFRAFNQRLRSTRGLPPYVVDAMWGYGNSVSDRDGARAWRERMEREFPNDPSLLLRKENRLSDRYLKESRQPDRYFAELEPVWASLGGARPREVSAVIHNAIVWAQESGRADATERWVDRYLAATPGAPRGTLFLARALARFPDRRARARALLRAEIAVRDAGPHEFRDLTETVPERRAANRRAAQPILVELGRQLLLAGDTAAGLDTLELAGRLDWNAAVFRALGEAWLAVRDTTKALRYLARVAADPGTDTTYAVALRSLALTRMTGPEWASRIETASDEMRRAVLARAGAQPLPGSIRVRDAEGRSRTLEELAAGKVTVVTFWSRSCPPAVRQLGALASVARRVQAWGVEVVTVTSDSISPQLDSLLAAREAGGLPVFTDYRGEVKRAFVNFARPEYYVLDAAGRIAFARTTLEEIPLLARVLLPDTGGVRP